MNATALEQHLGRCAEAYDYYGGTLSLVLLRKYWNIKR